MESDYSVLPLPSYFKACFDLNVLCCIFINSGAKVSVALLLLE